MSNDIRKLMQIAEAYGEWSDEEVQDLKDKFTDEYCPSCHGWGEILPPDVEQDMDNIIPCPDCGPGGDYEQTKPRLKSQVIKDLSHELDFDVHDLGLSDVEPEDLKGFPKIDEVQTLPREIKDRDPIKTDLSDVEYETCPECGVEGGHENGCPELAALYNEDLNEEQSEFRLAQIVGKDNFAELVSDLNTGGIDYSAEYFKPLYWHFLDEYPDEIPVGSRTGRPEDPEEYVLRNLERYHSEEIKQYMNIPDMDESIDEASHNFFDIMRTPSSRRDDEEPHIPRDRHAERPHTPGYDKLGSGAKAAADSRAQAYKFDEDDDGDVPSRRVSDEELLAKVESKINDALKAIAMGLKAEKVGESKVLAIQLRRDLKELKAFIESGGDALGLRAKLHLAFVKAEKLADYSYEYDDVLWELNDADNLLYLHLSGRPVAIDEGSDEGNPYICVHVKKGKHECYADSSYAAAKKAAEHWGLKSTAGIDAHLAIDESKCEKCGREGCECGPDCDCEPVKEAGDNLDWGVGDYVVTAWEKEGEWEVPLKVIGVRGDQVVVQDDYGNKEVMFPEDLRKAPEAPELFPGTKDALSKLSIGEDISLDNIVESVLDEYRSQPKDYEMSDEELAVEIEDETSEFERDNIDPEIEDEELGLRFD